jgi:segregation and condensation protein B
MTELERAIEALLFAAGAPLSVADLARRLPEGSDIGKALAALRAHYSGRGVGLEVIADRWQFRTAFDLGYLMVDESEASRKLSKAALETLAIIAYHQPVTRAEIETVRGVGLSRGTLDVLHEMNLIKLRGRRRTPGRPVTYGTTDFFLETFSLPSLMDLPGVADMRAAGLLELNMPADFSLPDPAGSTQIEDPLGLDELEQVEFAQDFFENDEMSR